MDKPYSHIEIKSDSVTGRPTFVKIDGQEIHGVTSIDYHVDVGSEIAEFHITMFGTHDVDAVGKIETTETNKINPEILADEILQNATDNELDDIIARLSWSARKRQFHNREQEGMTDGKETKD